MKSIVNIPYSDNSPRNVLDLHLPERKSFKTLIFFHGGGLEQPLDKESCGFREVSPGLVGMGFAAAAPNYRLYPSARYPEFIMDAAAATAWVIKNIGDYGDSEGIYLSGGSAGAYLAMMLCFDPRWLAPYGIHPDSLGGYLFDAGQPTVHFNVLREAGQDTRSAVIDERAPIYHISEGRSFPPMLTVCAEDDIPARYEQLRLLHATMRHFGYKEPGFIRVEGYTHCGYYNQIMLEIMAKFLSEN